MNGEEAFEIWAPEGAVWSPWAKPILFAQPLASGASLAVPHPIDASFAPDVERRAALVLDLPGATAVEAALALAERGYRPVPLFNVTSGSSEVVPVGPVRAALWAGCERLARANLRADSPPAFLLDSNRLGAAQPAPGMFDNRWMAFPQDFPSASFLRSRRIESALLVTEGDARVAEDLAHVLLRWKQGGLALSRTGLAGGPAAPLEVHSPRWFRRACYRALVLLRLRRNSAGGFGSIVPTPSSGGGGAFA